MKISLAKTLACALSLSLVGSSFVQAIPTAKPGAGRALPLSVPVVFSPAAGAFPGPATPETPRLGELSEQGLAVPPGLVGVTPSVILPEPAVPDLGPLTEAAVDDGPALLDAPGPEAEHKSIDDPPPVRASLDAAAEEAAQGRDQSGAAAPSAAFDGTAAGVGRAARSEFPEGEAAVVRLDREGLTVNGIAAQLVRAEGKGHRGLYRFELDGRYLLLKVLKGDDASWSGAPGESDALRSLRGALIGAQFESGRAVRGAGRLSSGERFLILDEAFPGQEARSLRESSASGDLRRFYAPGTDGERPTRRMAEMLLEVFSHGLIPHDADFLAAPDGRLRWLGAESWTRADPQALARVSLGQMGAEVAGTLARLAPDPAAARAFFTDFLTALQRDGRLSDAFKDGLLEAAFRDVPGVDGILEKSLIRASGEEQGAYAIARRLYEGLAARPEAGGAAASRAVERRYRGGLRRTFRRRLLAGAIGGAVAAIGVATIYVALERFGFSSAAMPWVAAGFNVAALALLISGLGRALVRLLALPFRLLGRLYGLLPARLRGLLYGAALPLRLLSALFTWPARLGRAAAPSAPERAEWRSGPTRRDFLLWSAQAGAQAAATVAILKAPAAAAFAAGFLDEHALDLEVERAIEIGPGNVMRLQFEDGSWGLTQRGDEYHPTWNSIHDRAAVTARVLSTLLELRPEGWRESFDKGLAFVKRTMLLTREDLRAMREPVSWNNERPYTLAYSLELFLDLLAKAPELNGGEAETRRDVETLLGRIGTSSWIYGEGVLRQGTFQLAMVGESLLRAHDAGFALPQRQDPREEVAVDAGVVAGMPLSHTFGSIVVLPAMIDFVAQARARANVLTRVLDVLQRARDPRTGLYPYSTASGPATSEYGSAARTILIERLLYNAEQRSALRAGRSDLARLRRARDLFLRVQQEMHDHVQRTHHVTHDWARGNVAPYYYLTGMESVIRALLDVPDDEGAAETARRLTVSMLDDQELDGSGEPNGTWVYSREATGVPYTTAAVLPLLRDLGRLRPYRDLRDAAQGSVARALLSPFLRDRQGRRTQARPLVRWEDDEDEE